MRPLRCLTAALVAVAALLAPTAQAAPTTASLGAADAVALEANPWLERRVLNAAHRGGAFEWPENTLFAFREGLLRGVDQLETDVAISKDGHVMVIHDTTVDRTTNGTGRIADLTLEQIKALDAGHFFVEGRYPVRDADPSAYTYRGVRTGERKPPAGYTPEWFTIPTLREVLETFPGVPLNIEIKPETPQQTTEAARVVAELLAEFERTDDVLVVASEDTTGLAFKAYAPEAHTAPGIAQAAAYFASSQGPLAGFPAGYAELHKALQLPAELSGIEVVTADLVKDAHANGLAVHVFTIDDRAEMERLVDLGVDSIMTNRTQLLEQVLQEKGLAADLEVPVPPCPAPNPGGRCLGDPR